MEIVSKKSFHELIKDGKVLSVAQGRPHLFLTPSNKVIKIFDSKEQWRHSYKFVYNAQRLERLGFLTPHIEGRFYCPEEHFVYVVYHYVEGLTVRKYLSCGNETVLEPLAFFMAYLHKGGVDFPDYYANQLLYVKDNFLLMDAHDARFFWLSLTIKRRIKNLIHLFDDPSYSVSEKGLKNFLQAYTTAAGFSKSSTLYFMAQFEYVFEKKILGSTMSFQKIVEV